MRTRRTRLLAVIALVVGPFAWLTGACSKQEPAPAPAPAATEEEEKPKKKKKKSEDDETPDTGSGGDEAPTATATAVKPGTGTGTKSTATSTSDADKNKLIACCTALRNAATAAGIASAAASQAIPGLPAAPPKEELDKNVKACDAAVVSWNGDLNESLKKVKGASPAKLPTVCTIGG